MPQQSPLPDTLETVEWPEENLSLPADKNGGFYPVKLGEAFDDERFVVTRKLGWGGFSSVWLARDRKEKLHVALKILSAYASAEIEAGRLGERDLLRNVTNASPLHQGFAHVIHLLHEFKFESSVGQHICFVTDVLSYNVCNIQGYLHDPRLPVEMILGIAKHVLKGLEYLHDQCQIVHSDLKPANILLLPSDLNTVVMQELSEDPSTIYEYPKTIPPNVFPFHPVQSAPLRFAPKDTSPIKHWVIADLGHAHPQGKHLSSVVQPYALRAPEVILGLEWGPAIDVWSLGCIMYELATNDWLFRPKAEDDIPRDVDHLALMTKRITGQDHDDAALKQYETQNKGKHQDLKDMLKRATERAAHLAPIESELTESTVYSRGAEDVADLVRVIRSLLTLDPAKRPRAAEVLLDPAFEKIP